MRMGLDYVLIISSTFYANTVNILIDRIVYANATINIKLWLADVVGDYGSRPSNTSGIKAIRRLFICLLTH